MRSRLFILPLLLLVSGMARAEDAPAPVAAAPANAAVPAPAAGADAAAVNENGEPIVSTAEYDNVPVGLLAAPTAETKTEGPKPVEIAPLALGQIPGVFEIPGASAQQQSTDDGPLTFDQIVNVYRQGKYPLVLKNLQPLADAGNHDAEQLMGIMYLNGQGMDKNVAKAFEYLSKAAEGGKPLAEHYLATMYFTGQNMEMPDNIHALMWIQIAILHYPDGPEKQRAMQDRDGIYVKMSRIEKNRAMELARDWLKNQGEAHLLDMQQ